MAETRAHPPGWALACTPERYSDLALPTHTYVWYCPGMDATHNTEEGHAEVFAGPGMSQVRAPLDPEGAEAEGLREVQGGGLEHEEEGCLIGALQAVTPCTVSVAEELAAAFLRVYPDLMMDPNQINPMREEAGRE